MLLVPSISQLVPEPWRKPKKVLGQSGRRRSKTVTGRRLNGKDLETREAGCSSHGACVGQTGPSRSCATSEHKQRWRDTGDRSNLFQIQSTQFRAILWSSVPLAKSASGSGKPISCQEFMEMIRPTETKPTSKAPSCRKFI